MDIFQLIFGDDGDREIDHRHKCPSCGYVWNHTAAEIEDGGYDYDFAHLCPNCGNAESRAWYEGELPSLGHFYGQSDFEPSGTETTAEPVGIEDEVDIYELEVVQV